MTDTNWPNPERPGVPMFPERDGWHWLSNRPNDAPFPAEWSHEDYCNAETEWYWDMGEEREDAYEMKGLYYHGLCLTPTQISEMLAGERERCVEALQDVAKGYRQDAEEVGTVTATNRAEEKIDAVDDCLVKIRNLGAAS